MSRHQSRREWRKYEFKLGNKVLPGGISRRPLGEREGEHRLRPGWEKGHIAQVGRATTGEAARNWEKANGYS